jgi:prepilin-type N-terminal cleavage/methylation domain-containing protein
MSLKRIKGFSLLELMIVIAILGGISLVVMNLTKQSNKNVTKYQFDTETGQLVNELNGILSDPKACLATVQLSPLDHIQQFLQTSNLYVSKYPTGSVNGNGKVKILSYALNLGPGADTPYLKINFENKEILKNTDSSNPTISKIIKLEVTPNGAATAADITTCRSVSTATDTMWNRITGTTNIHYSSGNVGIGVAAPASKLDIAGEVKIANTGVACSGANEGSVRYNSTLKSMEFCNGTVWNPIGGSGGTQVDMYRCPGPVSLGGGAWGYYGCQNQITNMSSCYEIEYPTVVSFACTYVGKMTLSP